MPPPCAQARIKAFGRHDKKLRSLIVVMGFVLLKRIACKNADFDVGILFGQLSLLLRGKRLERGEVYRLIAALNGALDCKLREIGLSRSGSHIEEQMSAIFQHTCVNNILLRGKERLIGAFILLMRHPLHPRIRCKRR